MRTCSIAAALLIVAWASSVPVQAAEQGVQDKGDGLWVMHVGNSHSHALRFLEPLAWAVRHRKHKDGDVNILGAPLRWNWDHPEQNKWSEKLGADKSWDAITLLAWADDDTSGFGSLVLTDVPAR